MSDRAIAFDTNSFANVWERVSSGSAPRGAARMSDTGARAAKRRDPGASCAPCARWFLWLFLLLLVIDCLQ
ncbi:MAG: hypothetical protein LBC21_01445 [Oscillospiraceae bacterium]|jgi:hypothetical protein|nr:hypothetical protein [Oscillospiraceae bacterium]